MISASLVKELRDKTGAGMMDAKKALEATAGNIDKASDWLRENGMLKAAKKEARIAAEGLAKIFTKDNKAVIVEVNAETDFVSKNTEFQAMIDEIGATILENEVTTIEEALKLPGVEGTMNDLIISKTAKIGEKLSFRRFEVLNKNAEEFFGEYIHMGGKIAVLTVIKGANAEVAKDVAMHTAAMKPQYIFKESVPAEVIKKEEEFIKIEAMNEGKSADIAEKMVAGRINKFYKEIVLAEQAFVKNGDISVGTYVKDNNGEIVKMVRYEVGEGMEKRVENFAEEVRNQLKD